MKIGNSKKFCFNGFGIPKKLVLVLQTFGLTCFVGISSIKYYHQEIQCKVSSRVPFLFIHINVLTYALMLQLPVNGLENNTK